MNKEHFYKIPKEMLLVCSSFTAIVYGYIRLFAENKEVDSVWCSNEYIAKDLNEQRSKLGIDKVVTRFAVSSAISKLIELGYLKKTFNENTRHLQVLDVININNSVTKNNNNVIKNNKGGYKKLKQGVTKNNNKVLQKTVTNKDKDIKIYDKDINIKNSNLLKKDWELFMTLKIKVLKNYPFYDDPRYFKEAEVKHIRLMRERDKLDHKQIEYLINWACDDEFWQQQVRSASNLRKHAYQLIVQIKGRVKSSKVMDIDKIKEEKNESNNVL